MSDGVRPVAVVAGGTGGVGTAIVEKLVRDGFDVAVGYRSSIETATALAERLAGTGAAVAPVHLDLGSAASAAEGVAAAVERFGRVDSAICAAGPYIPMKWFGTIDGDEFESIMGADTRACFHFARAVVPALRSTAGNFVALSTSAAGRHIAKDSLSSIPKAAVEAIVRAIAAEESRHGVRANIVRVGFINAGMFHELVRRGDFSEEYIAAAIKNIPLRRMGDAVDIANAVAYFAGPQSGYVTGQTIAVDGGLGL